MFARLPVCGFKEDRGAGSIAARLSCSTTHLRRRGESLSTRSNEVLVQRVVIHRHVVGAAAAIRTPCRRASPDQGCPSTVGMLSPRGLAQFPESVNTDAFKDAWQTKGYQPKPLHSYLSHSSFS